jgi:hypothetical protein
VSNTPINTYINERGFTWHFYERDNVNRDAYFEPATKLWTVSGTDIAPETLTEDQEDVVILLIYTGEKYE